MAEVMDHLVRFITKTDYSSIADEPLAYAKKLCLSQLAAMVGGIGLPASQIVAKLAMQQGGVQEAGVAGFGLKVPVLQAALCNATFAHATELEDDDLSDRLTIGTIIPTAFTLGQALGSSGRDVLESIIIGYDVQAKFCKAAGGPSRAGYMGFTTGAWGPAASAAKLMKLDPERVRMTMAITASLLEGAHRQVPSMAHFLESGVGSSNGIYAAQLAKEGFTGNPDIIEIPHGLWDMMNADKESLPELHDMLDGDLRIMRVGIKRYGCAYVMQRIIDGAAAVRREHGINNEDLDQIEIHVAPWFTDWVNNPDPQTPEDSRFSIHHFLAAVMLGDPMNLRTLDPATIHDSEYAETRKKILVFCDESRSRTFFDKPDGMIFRLKDGREHRILCERAIGHPPLYLTEEQVMDKFRACVDYSAYLAPAATERVCELVLNLEKVQNVGEIMELLT